MAPRWQAVHRDSDYRRDRDDPPALAHLQIGRIEPEVGPFPGQRAVEELMHPLIYVFAKLGHRALGDAAEPHRLHQIFDLPRRDATTPCLLDHRHQRLLRRPARLQKAWEVRPRPQLRHPQVQRPHPCLQFAVTLAVAVGLTPLITLIAARADHALHIHSAKIDPPDRFLHAPNPSASAARLPSQHAENRPHHAFAAARSRACLAIGLEPVAAPWPDLGHRGSPRSVVDVRNSTINRRPRWLPRLHRQRGAKVHHVLGHYLRRGRAAQGLDRGPPA